MASMHITDLLTNATVYDVKVITLTGLVVNIELPRLSRKALGVRAAAAGDGSWACTPGASRGGPGSSGWGS